MKSLALQIERKSSIESEPRTLDLTQIQHAREAALSVLSTRTIDEALRIFTEGLEPVASANHKEKVAMEREEKWDDLASHLTVLPPVRPTLRDVVTAPF